MPLSEQPGPTPTEQTQALKRAPTFALECDLVREFARLLHVQYPGCSVSEEFDYARGRVDLVVVLPNGELIGFEAKLTKWRHAMHQAYRNTSFCERSYVVLPAKTANVVRKHLDEFKRRGVGVCVVNHEEVDVLLDSPKHTPLQPWLNHEAREYIMTSNDGSQSGERVCADRLPRPGVQRA